MTERSDLSVEWNRSPRIVTVAAPSTELSMQDFVDTAKGVLEVSWNGIDEPALHQSSGKETLDDTTDVGITVTLLDAKIAFEARFTSISQGTATSGDSTGKSLVDISATFQSDGVVEGDTVINFDDMSLATVISVPFETQLITYALQDGTLNTWTIGDNYKVFHVAQCELDGGNLVAVDDVDIDIGNPMIPVSPTAFTQIIKTSSASATQADLEDIRFASFGGQVTIDAINGISGTVYPAGNLENPSNNWTDALAIGNSRGLNKYNIRGSYSFTASDVLDGKIIEGHRRNITSVTLANGTSVQGTGFIQCGLSGNAGGSQIWLSEAAVVDLDGLGGGSYAEGCSFGGTIKFAGTGKIILHDCKSSWPGSGEPILDFDDKPIELEIGNWIGALTLKNKSSAESVRIEIPSGKCTLDSTVTAGSITIRNALDVVDNTDPDLVTVNRDAQVQSAPGAYGGEAHYHASGGHGEYYPWGMPWQAVDNETDVLAITTRYGLERIIIDGAYTLTQNHDGKTFVGESQITNDVINLNGQSVNHCTFERCYVTGAGTGNVTGIDSLFEDVSGVSITATSCGFRGTLYAGSLTLLKSATFPGAPGSPVVLDAVGAGRFINIDGTGDVELRNMVDTSLCVIILRGGTLTIDSSCTGGLVQVSGNCWLTNNAAGTTVIDKTREGEQSSIHGADSWEGAAALDEQLADHTLAGTYGHELATKADIQASASTEYKVATSGSVIYGTQVSGTYESANIRDNVYWQIQETGPGGDGLTVELVYNLTSADHKPGVFTIFGRYVGTPGTTHYMELWVYNYEASAWEQLEEEFMPGGMTSDSEYMHEYFERNIDRDNNNEVKFRLIHNVTTYVDTHYLYLDYASTSSIEAAPGVDAGVIADAVWDEDRVDHTTAGTFGATDEWAGEVDEAAIADAVWDEPLTGATHNVPTSAGRRLRTAGPDAALIREGTCQVGSTLSTIVLDTGASGTDNFYDHMWVYIAAGTGSGQVRTVHNYIGSTKTGSIIPNWLIIPDNTSEFAIIAQGSTHVHEIETEGIAAVVDAVWDEDRVDHTTPGTYGATDEWASAIDADAIADAVWDADADDHDDPGTMGELQNIAGTPGAVGSPFDPTGS